MKVLKHGNQKTYKAVCFNCGAILEYMDEDIQVNLSNKKYVGCPECETPIWEVDTDGEPEEKILTIDNIQFPEDFDSFEADSGAVRIDDTEINNNVKLCLRELKADKEEYGVYRFVGSGNSMVLGIKHESEYVIFVCKNYFEASIPR